MVAPTDWSSMGATAPVYDVRTLNHLRSQAQSNPQSQTTQQMVAREFESLFINMLLQRMRDAVPREGLFDNQQTRMIESLADQQLASSLAQPGIGLAQALLRQMQGRGLESQEGTSNAALLPQISASDDVAEGEMAARLASVSGLLDMLRTRKGGASVAPMVENSEQPVSSEGRVTEFLERLQPIAQQVAQATGVPLKLMLGQAALESGWGRREINHTDGRPSHNVFGIKADASWQGKSVDVQTTEFVDGVATKVSQRFRAYDSYDEAFADYARMLVRSPRYAQVLTTDDPQEAARRVQKAGYATDPNYANKLIRVMGMMDG